MTHRPNDVKRRQLRKSLGLCTRCGGDKGPDASATMCRPCANASGRLARRNRVNSDDTSRRKIPCENCLKLFRPKAGRRAICDSCSPWFTDRTLVPQEQAVANKVLPATLHPVLANKIIDDWMR